MNMYTYIFSIALFFCFTVPAAAHVPVLVEQESIEDIDTIDDPELSQAFYGTLATFPHTFEIRAEEPFTLYTQILVPDIDSSKNNISGIIIKEPATGGRVEEVARLDEKNAAWTSQFEPFGGDTYRHGPEFEKELEPGIYRIEVHTPDNREKYVLVVGKREEITLGYFELIRRLAGVKLFFEKSQFRIIESPFVYIPLWGISIVALAIYILRIRKRRV